MMFTKIAVRRRRMHRRLSFGLATATWVVGSLFSLGGHATDARAADADAERAARAHFRQAETEYAAGRYTEALSEYQAGYEVQPLPGFLVNIAQCQRRIGDLERARATYGKFVIVAPDSPLLPEVRRLIEELDRLIAETERARALPSAAGDIAAASPPTERPGGSHGLTRAPGGRAILPPSAVDPPGPPGTSVAAGVDLTEAPMAPSEQAPNDRVTTTSRHRWWLWGSVAVVAVGAATLAAVLSAPGTNTIHDGSLGSLRR
jgi:hypothetical protein